MRHPPRFTKSDVMRVAKGLLAAGVGFARVEVELDSGKITFMTTSISGSEETTELDTWIAKDARQT
jgi:hypothetical protein